MGPDFCDGAGHGSQLPVGGGPVAGVADVVVHVVVFPGVGQLQGGPQVLGVRADSPQASVKTSRSAGDGCGRRHGFMGK